MKTLPLKIDLHVHSNYSYDSIMTPEELVFYAKKKGLDGVAITDHDRIDGAFKISQKTDFPIIPGMEIYSSDGHIIALNVQETIPRGLSAQETVDRIHESGGIAVVCHPGSFFVRSVSIKVEAKFDAVETINASSFPFKYSIKQAQKLALKLGAPQVAGTDAHYGPELGFAYTLIDAENNTSEIVDAIKKGLCQPFGSPIPWRLRLEKILLSTRRSISEPKEKEK